MRNESAEVLVCFFFLSISIPNGISKVLTDEQHETNARMFTRNINVQWINQIGIGSRARSLDVLDAFTGSQNYISIHLILTLPPIVVSDIVIH